MSSLQVAATAGAGVLSAGSALLCVSLFLLSTVLVVSLCALIGGGERDIVLHACCQSVLTLHAIVVFMCRSCMPG